MWVALAFAFPAVALFALRRGGSRLLAVVTCLVLAIIVATGLALASPLFGNALAAERGYAPVAIQVVAFLLLTAGLPVLCAAAALGALAHRPLHTGVRYAIAVAAALLGFAAGVLGSFWLMWR